MTETYLSNIDPDTLPPQIRQLVALIGLPETFKLLQAKGGTQLRIPKIANRAEVLPEILQDESVDLLCKAWSGKVFDVPKVDKILLQIRNQVISKARATQSASQLARSFDLTRRQIINICKLPEDYNQVDMFD
ncbi:MAG: hypothetical protein GQ532_09970 [Methylomarinum sp.]|nr:hypothetical protein [Methylomarinum sp.]